MCGIEERAEGGRGTNASRANEECRGENQQRGTEAEESDERNSLEGSCPILRKKRSDGHPTALSGTVDGTLRPHHLPERGVTQI